MGRLDLPAADALAGRAGVGPVHGLTPLAGGANNRVFRLDAGAGTFLLKSYFRHPDDPRDRLGAEWAFARFAWDAGVRCIPEPLAADPEAGLGLFEFVHGRALHGTTAGEPAVDQALAFFRLLRRAKDRAAGLPDASESCFRLSDHLATVERRVSRLRTFAVGGAVDQTAAGFVDAELVPAWRQVVADARRNAGAYGLPLDRPLEAADRCPSPSDFGFHNALLAHDGRLRFLDFEYAGWDDPAKLVCDFFCQPAVPAPASAFERFARGVAAEFAAPAVHLARATLLRPVYRVKWVCIMLNEFLPVGLNRRAFAGTVAEQEARKANQLAKARAALAAIFPPSPTRKVA
ncbi:MAG: aminoglycoside phosphotransferase family protein [Gemmataceae bacterium]|nr:aminoglycoside phosphotransferase family protein [Gemmataceae bacterium]